MGVLAVISQVDGVDRSGILELGGEGGGEGGEVSFVPEQAVEEDHRRIGRRLRRRQKFAVLQLDDVLRIVCHLLFAQSRR